VTAERVAHWAEREGYAFDEGEDEGHQVPQEDEHSHGHDESQLLLQKHLLRVLNGVPHIEGDADCQPVGNLSIHQGTA